MDLSSVGFSTASLTGAATAAAVAPIIALAGAILIAIVFLKPKNKDKFTGWKQRLLAHVNFDHFLLSGILKFLYVFSVLYSVVYGIILLFTGQVIFGLITAVLAPIALRVVFEQILLLLSIRQEAAETNELLRRMQGLPPRGGAPYGGPQPGGTPPMRPPVPQSQRPGTPPDPRYGAQPGNRPPQPGQGYGGYGQQPPRRQPSDYGMTQRYAPVRGNTYPAPGAQTREPQPGATGRFTPVPPEQPPKEPGRE